MTYEADPESIPPPAQLAVREFITACTKTFNRDVGDAWPDPAERDRRYWDEGTKGGWWLLSASMRDLVNPHMWRLLLYAASPFAGPRQLRPLSTEEREVATVQDAIDLVDYLIEVTCGFVRFAPGNATVAKPIDVAAITPHEGFRWVRRKHYFSAELNPPVLS